MGTFKIISSVLIFGLFSCTDSNTNKLNAGATSVDSDTTQIDEREAKNIPDTTVKLIVDDYPITNEMFAKQIADNSSTYKKTSGLTQSLDKVWFGNDTIKQTLVFELYTDNHRLITYHFYNKELPDDLIKQIELHTTDGEIATEKQKQKDFQGFLFQAEKINSVFFVSGNGFKLGDNKGKIIKIYGNADEHTINNGFEKLVWKFIGDNLYSGKQNLKGKPLVKDSYGHQVIMYFKENKLAGQILYNDIP
jgi:hypothetical protein